MMKVLYVRKPAYDNVWTFSGEASEKIRKSSVFIAGFLAGIKTEYRNNKVHCLTQCQLAR
jgi:hypothetical protein